MFTDVDAERLREAATIPAGQEVWTTRYQRGWLELYRGGSGQPIYWLKLDGCPAGVRVVESWASREPQQYAQGDIEYDRRMVDFILRGLLLGQTVERPDPKGSNP